MKKVLIIFLYLLQFHAYSQQLDSLTVEKIMRDPKWIGTSPSNVSWSTDSKYLFFNWNPDNKLSDSVYFITRGDLKPTKANTVLRELATNDLVVYNTDGSAFTFAKEGDIFYGEVKTNTIRRVAQTSETESNPYFILYNSKVVYSQNQNLYTWDISSGTITQLTKFEKGEEAKKENLSYQEQWLKNDQLQNFEVLRQRKQKRDSTEAAVKAFQKGKTLKTIYTQDKVLSSATISPNGRFVTYRLTRPVPNTRNTIVPNYVTETGFTQEIPGRTKVGAVAGTSEFFVFDKVRDSVILVKTDSIPGITDLPDYVKDYATKDTAKKKPSNRSVTITGPYWNESGTNGVVAIRSADNKDHWLMLLDAVTGKMKLLDRQRDEAWVSGPGVFLFSNQKNRWINENTFWYQSEITGYSHLYAIDVLSGKKTALTWGQFEVQDAFLSKNKKFFYLSTNEVHPGEQQFYRMPVTGGVRERITTMTGANTVTLSPDEKQIAFLYSYSNKPWELYLQNNLPGSKAIQITDKAMTKEFTSYKWRDPEVVTFPASDGATVYARLYRPADAKQNGPAVIFVHGAGYLQNAHKWWSSYFREYMFHNLLVDKGYTVIDVDYRGSAGYGRNWRTGIYRYMGGKDLDDQVDAAKFLTQKFGVDPNRIGIYGGSYGGFITLMGMFTKPGVFAAGAGLRSVTDWGHYNHPYTANILNEPFNDSIAYRRSSPIYHAEGLKGALLMCHGMVDVNVHFQDIVRLSQRLIELKKENWELAVYPMEDHGFVEPSSWTDEYKRILKLFETNLKK
jgi:dipeptidyl aminopeptidase/acylaminoacyl peptidase